MTQATPQEILNILSEDIEEVLRQIALENVEVSYPLDGAGPRILVRVEEGAGAKVPTEITVEHRKRLLTVPLEASETYEPFSSQ
ncbi:MAG: hypothetical protein AAGP08_17440 [Pseudomonadota bacterium]